MATCQACGREIDFLKGPNGRMIPTQRVRSAYVVELTGEAGEPVLVKIGEGEELRISHFETCTDPERFSRRKS